MSETKTVTVERYDLENVSNTPYVTDYQLRPTHGGDWVRYDDHLTALAAAEKRADDAERDKLVWQQAAYVVGECIATTGPAGYYDMAPADWRDWLIADVKGQLAALGHALPGDTTQEG